MECAFFVPKYEQALHKTCAKHCLIHCTRTIRSRSQQPRGLRRRSTAARLLRLWVRIPLGAWTFFCCECCVLSGRGLCNEQITRSEESYRLWRVVVCDLETSKEEAKSPLKDCEYKPTRGCDAERRRRRRRRRRRGGRRRTIRKSPNFCMPQINYDTKISFFET